MNARRPSCPGSARATRHLDRRGFLHASTTMAGLAAVGRIPAGAPAAPAAARRLAPGIPGPYPGRVVEVQQSRRGRATACPTPTPSAGWWAAAWPGLTGIDEPVEAWRSMFEPRRRRRHQGQPGRPAARHQQLRHGPRDRRGPGIRRGPPRGHRRLRPLQGPVHPGRLPGEPPRRLPVGLGAPSVRRGPARHRPLRPRRLRRPWTSSTPGPGSTTRRTSGPGARTWRRSSPRRINKLICIPVLKDHGSGGVTLALKNMSHGLVNNVSRSHGTHDTNTCNLFIPAIVSQPVIRQKAVLQVLDGLNAGLPGGPGRPEAIRLAYGALFFATDPVAMDRVCWEIVDAKRVAEGMPPVAEDGHEGQGPDRDRGVRLPAAPAHPRRRGAGPGGLLRRRTSTIARSMRGEDPGAIAAAWAPR